MDKYQFEEGMSKVSGMGGAYEESCRKMITVGLEWFDTHQKACPLFAGSTRVFGLLSDENDDAAELLNIVVASVDDCTGAMIQAAIEHIMRAHSIGWEAYVKEMEQGRRSE